ncbi:MAG: DEAD/DEAH box helicase, partial [Acidobacteriota bacterium]
MGLKPVLLAALDEVGYESPSPIQARTIPPILAGRDVVGQAQTGTGKTAAFALPILHHLDPGPRSPQARVLTPTRELALQVAEAFQRYASSMPGFLVLPVYGGQAYEGQLRQLRRGVHVVVGTPGRVMDHMRRGTLDLKLLTHLVLDEADEMLRMGFIEDVEWILEQTPESRQISLFSATMPPVIRRIASQHLTDPEEITIRVKTTTASTIRQRYWTVSGVHKLDALTRILEAESYDAMIIFVRTKTATVELAEKLGARGVSAAAINGDMAQNQRERTVDRLRAGKLDVLVATDVAARGLDVERISHVVNFDVPYDTDSYVHRVGRTGRAGRTGEAILFISPRERRMLHHIEQATRQRIQRMELPSTEVINDRRVARFQQKITDTLEAGEWKDFYSLLEQYQAEHDRPALEIAAALAKLMQGEEPLLLEPPRERPRRERRERFERDAAPPRRGGGEAGGMERYRIEVGRAHGVQPGNIVGAIANEAGLESSRMGKIMIHDEFSTIDLPPGMPERVHRLLQRVRVCGEELRISYLGAGGPGPRRKPEGFKPRGGKPGGFKPGGFKPRGGKP